MEWLTSNPYAALGAGLVAGIALVLREMGKKAGEKDTSPQAPVAAMIVDSTALNNLTAVGRDLVSVLSRIATRLEADANEDAFNREVQKRLKEITRLSEPKE